MATFTLETWGEICPVPVIKAEKRLKQLEIGDTLEIITDHSCSVRSFQNWNKRHKHVLVIEEVDNGVWCIKLTKDR